MKYTMIAGLAFAASALIGTSASADTYIVVVNTLQAPITVNAGSVEPKAGGWTALDAVVQLDPTAQYVVSDLHKKCADGGWDIQSSGPTTTHYCIQLGLGEVGCLYAAARTPEGGGTPFIEMTKVNLGMCSDKWWTQAGKGPIFEIADKITTTGASIATVVGTIKGAK